MDEREQVRARTSEYRMPRHRICLSTSLARLARGTRLLSDIRIHTPGVQRIVLRADGVSPTTLTPGVVLARAWAQFLPTSNYRDTGSFAISERIYAFAYNTLAISTSRFFPPGASPITRPSSAKIKPPSSARNELQIVHFVVVDDAAYSRRLLGKWRGGVRPSVEGEMKIDFPRGSAGAVRRVCATKAAALALIWIF